MKGIPLSGVVLGALMAAALAEPSRTTASEPIKLTEPQLDAVTAGLVGVSAGAIAASTGSDFATASTTTITEAKTMTLFGLGTGEGSASAIGCCGTTSDAVALVYVDGQGDFVVAQSSGVTKGDEVSTEADASGSVFAVDLQDSCPSELAGLSESMSTAEYNVVALSPSVSTAEYNEVPLSQSVSTTE